MQVSTGTQLPVIDLGRMNYAEALKVQREHHAEVLAQRDDVAGGVGRLLLVEHDPPVITFGRRPGSDQHLLADEQRLEALGIEVHTTDRGGDITYHGPGQLVVYPIIDLNRAHMRLHDYMRCLEQSVIDVCASFDIAAQREQSATGVWVDGAGPNGASAKVCAIGVRIQQWVSMHGLALNVTTDLSHFECIVPCGLTGRTVTSLHRLLGDACPTITEVKAQLTQALEAQLIPA